jgi:hypothetical protein
LQVGCRLRRSRLDQQRAVDGHGHGLTDHRVGQERMRTGLCRGAHVAQRRVGVGLVEVQTLDRGAEAVTTAVPLRPSISARIVGSICRFQA